MINVIVLAKTVHAVEHVRQKIQSSSIQNTTIERGVLLFERLYDTLGSYERTS